MGHDGLDRALWEYKAGSAKKSVWGQRAYMSYGSDSYIGQLHASLDELLDPRVVQACKRIRSDQSLRLGDFVVGWCAASSGSSAVPPFLDVGPRGDWASDQVGGAPNA